MADVTISSLPLGTPSSSALLPYSQGGTTYSMVLAQLSSLPFIPKAWVGFNGRTNFTVVDGETRCQIWCSYNILKVVRINSGIYNIHFNTPINAPYCVTLGIGDAQNVGNERAFVASQTTTILSVYTALYNDVWQDNDYVGAQIFSS